MATRSGIKWWHGALGLGGIAVTAIGVGRLFRYPREFDYRNYLIELRPTTLGYAWRTVDVFGKTVDAGWARTDTRAIGEARAALDWFLDLEDAS